MLSFFVTIVFLWHYLFCDPATIDDALQPVAHMLEAKCEHQWFRLILY